MVKADTKYDKRVFVIIGGGENWLGVFDKHKWLLIIKINRQLFIINFAGGSAMKAAETLREEGFKG